MADVTQRELDLARMRVEWAARHIPNGPAYGIMRAGSTDDASKSDIVLAVALITRRMEQEREHG